MKIVIKDFEIVLFGDKEEYVLNTNMGDLTLEELVDLLREVLEEAESIRGEIKIAEKPEFKIEL